MKVNKIRKNSPRVLELDVSKRTLTICKPNGKDFSIRDCTITAETLLAVQLSRSTTQLELEYLTVAGDSKSKKQWKVLFPSQEERERFYRLLRINLLTAVSPSPSQAPAKYTPTSKAFSSSAERVLRSLPLQQIAAELHSVWMLERTEKGWKYGKAYDEEKKMHPSVLSFKQLPNSTRSRNVKFVQQTIGTVLALGFDIHKKNEDGNFTTGRSRSFSNAISKDLLHTIEFLAETVHDTWAEYKMQEGWSYNANKSYPDKTHPVLRPLAELDARYKDKNRNTAYKILGSLVDLGYVITKADDEQKDKDDSHAHSPLAHSPNSEAGRSYPPNSGPASASSMSPSSSASSPLFGSFTVGSLFRR